MRPGQLHNLKRAWKVQPDWKRTPRWNVSTDQATTHAVMSLTCNRKARTISDTAAQGLQENIGKPEALALGTTSHPFNTENTIHDQTPPMKHTQQPAEV